MTTTANPAKTTGPFRRPRVFDVEAPAVTNLGRHSTQLATRAKDLLAASGWISRPTRDGPNPFNDECRDALGRLAVVVEGLARRAAGKINMYGYPGERDDLVYHVLGDLAHIVGLWEPGRTMFSTYCTWSFYRMMQREMLQHREMIRRPVHQQEKTREDGVVLVKQMSEITEKGLKAPADNSGEWMDAMDRMADLHRLIAELPERERVAVEGRYGINRENSLHLHEVGEMLGVSKERARQLISRGIVRMAKTAGDARAAERLERMEGMEGMEDADDTEANIDLGLDGRLRELAKCASRAANTGRPRRFAAAP